MASHPDTSKIDSAFRLEGDDMSEVKGSSVDRIIDSIRNKINVDDSSRS